MSPSLRYTLGATATSFTTTTTAASGGGGAATASATTTGMTFSLKNTAYVSTFVWLLVYIPKTIALKDKSFFLCHYDLLSSLDWVKILSNIGDLEQNNFRH